MRHPLLFIGMLAVIVSYPQFVYVVIVTSPFAWSYPVLWLVAGPLLALGILFGWKNKLLLAVVSLACAGFILMYPILGLLSSRIIASLLPGLTLAVAVSYYLAPRLVFPLRAALASVLLLFAITNLLAPYAWHVYALLSPDLEYALVAEFKSNLATLALVILISVVPVGALVASSRGLTKRSSRPPSAAA